MSLAEARRAAARTREPRIDRASLRRLVYAVVKPGDGRKPMAVPVLAQRAGLTPRTIYRILEEGYPDRTVNLDTADRVLVAIDRDLSDVELVCPE